VGVEKGGVWVWRKEGCGCGERRGVGVEKGGVQVLVHEPPSGGTKAHCDFLVRKCMIALLKW
jgi:hypothetical protein